MPRPRVKDADRKRVARACDTCKRRKEKCDGNQPCLLCKRRSREDECQYSDGKRQSAPRSDPIDNSNPSQPEHPRASSDDAEIAVESLLTLSGGRGTMKTPPPGSNQTYPQSVPTGPSHAPVPKLARLLQNGHGKYIFVGDSGTLAFLQNVRRIVKTTIGDCALTSDPKRHAMVEAIPGKQDEPSEEPGLTPKPSLHNAQQLVRSYLLATSGIIDLFDQSEMVQHILAWVEEAQIGNSATGSIFYLILAIGAQNLPTTNEEEAAFYFAKGRELAIASFMDDPSVLTVQSYILIAFYMVTGCRRNGGFMLLGIAIRAAYALGLHRSDISLMFEERERQTRERVWKSLRVLDMFLSASLGRPPATSEVDGGNLSWEGASRGYEDIHLQSSHSSAMMRICFIFERILNEVYCRREVSVQLVNGISRQFRDWNLHLDEGFQNYGLDQSEVSSVSRLQQMIGLAHLRSTYFFSIILLTRPFLIFDVSTRLKNSDNDEESLKTPQAVTLSEACIDAALRSIEIASDFVHTLERPGRPLVIINSLFISALVIGLAMLGGYDKTFPLVNSLEQVKGLLLCLAKNDPGARRFSIIVGYLQQAVSEYVRQRDQKQLMKRRQGIQSIFGDILNQEPSSEKVSEDANRSVPQRHSDKMSISNMNQPEPHDDRWPRIPNDEEVKRDVTITTSGALAPSNREPDFRGPDIMPDSVPYGLPQNMGGQFNADQCNLSTYSEDFPLFSLTDSYDTMSDPFFLEFLSAA